MEQVAAIDMTSIYTILGAFLVVNIGAIITGLGFIMKIVFSAGTYNEVIKNLRKDVDAAHQKIRDLEQKK